MPFDPTLAAIRFGVGLSPTIAPPRSVDDMLELLAGPDNAALALPIDIFDEVSPSAKDMSDATRALTQARGTDAEDAAQAYRVELREAGREAFNRNLATEMARNVSTADGFRERLTRFWADHFTARGGNSSRRHFIQSYVEGRIRPHVAGRFGDMLSAAITNPLMIYTFDQNFSVGPNSPTGQRSGGGLNENLAREVIELHTLGVGAAYTQTDVTQLAELLTGLTANLDRGGYFRASVAEPGAETVLGRTYGGDDPSMDDIIAVLNDLAMHPDTARHLARKLVIHFVGPQPDEHLIEAMAHAYLGASGQLIAMYDVLLSSPQVWHPALVKVKQPIDFITSSLRAFGQDMAVVRDLSSRNVVHWIIRPLQGMGQSYNRPIGPDGWPEDEASWITPQGMAGRITWAMQVPERLLERLPDPREFVFTALGPTPPEPVLFAANAAETVSDGIGIVLASAAFQRR